MPPGAAGWQVSLRPDPGLAMGGQIWSPLGISLPGAAQPTHSPSLAVHASWAPGEERFWAPIQTRTVLVPGREAGPQ